MTGLDVSRGAVTPGTDLSAEDDKVVPRDWLAGRAFDKADLALASGIALAIIAIAYVFRSAVVPTDPWHYVRSALQFPSDNWVPLGYTRYGIVLASLPPARLFGNSQITYYFWPFISAGALAAAVALLARRWWGWVAAIVAVALLFANRIVFYNLSRGYPDIMSMALFTLAVLCAVIGRDRLVANQRATPWILAVGFLLGWGFEVRETSMIAWPLIAVILYHKRSIGRSIVLLLLPLLLWAILDIGISTFAYGDPLLKVHALATTDISATKTATGELKSGDLVDQSRWFYLTIIPLRALKSGGGVWMVAAGAVAILGVFVRDKAVRLMSAWFVGVYLLTVLPAGLLDPSHPRGRLDIERYWIPLFPATSLVVGGLVALTAGWLAAHRPLGTAASVVPRAITTVALTALACGGPLMYAASFATSHPAFAPNGGDALEGLRDHLKDRSFAAGRVWTDWETARILPIYQRDFFGGLKVWSGKPKSITSAGAYPRAGDYVLLFSAHSETCPFCRDALKPWLSKHPKGAPANWDVSYVSNHNHLVLYRVR